MTDHQQPSIRRRPKRDDTHPDFDKIVGANIASLRKARGYTQEHLAQRVESRGVRATQQMIVKIEKGQRPLKFQEADVIGKSLDVPVDVILEAVEATFDETEQLLTLIRDLHKDTAAIHRLTRDLVQRRESVRFSIKKIRRGDNPPVNDAVMAQAEAVLDIKPGRVAELGESEHFAMMKHLADQFPGAKTTSDVPEHG